MRGLLASRQAWLTLAVLAILVALPWTVSAYILGVLTVAYYFGVFAMAWDLLFGFANEVNFGPTFLMGSGAYAAGLLNGQGLPVWVCLIAGAAAALAGGVVLAVPALRLTGP
jgi:branched-chain amino acid transport system permease protein